MPLARRLAVLAGCLAAAAAWSGAALAAGEPTNVVAPSIEGRPDVGQTLTGDPGEWTGAPTSFAYEWQRCNTRVLNCVAVGGATNTYTVVAADAGQTIVLKVTATNAAGSADAPSPPAFVSAYTLGTAHVLVHYLGGAVGAITQTQAGDVAGRAERAYAAMLADGYPAPRSDGTAGGDGRIDIYVQSVGVPGVLGVAVPDDATEQTSGYIVLDGANPKEALDQQTIAHELFHLVQFGIWLPTLVSDHWLLEGSAEWMGYRVDGYAGDLDLGEWSMSLDCRDPLGASQCDLEDPYRNGGYSRWPFFEYVTERWGSAFVKDVFAQGAAGAGSATAALSRALSAKGASLADTFTDWTVANMTGGYSVTSLRAVQPTPDETIWAGTGSGALPTTEVVAVNHLSARYVAIRRGSADQADGPCYAATLSLSVALPAGVGSRPYLWWSQKQADGTNAEAAKALTVSGDTASITVPWDTCDWGTTQAYLSLPNPTSDVDGQSFRITGSVSVDRSTRATATLPPPGIALPGETEDAPGADDAPQVRVFGPQLIRIPSGRRVLRVIVSSDGSGALQAALGGLRLGSARLRPGGNDLRFRLPTKALRALRRTSAASSVLTLTPLSPSGAAGKRVVRRVAVQQPAPKKHSARR